MGFVKSAASTFFFICIFCIYAYTQSPIYTSYTMADGVPGQTVYCVFQDSKGYIWTSTDAGVSRFDGRHFKSYTTNNGLTDNEVFHIFEDSRGRLWFITFNGKPCYYLDDVFYHAGNDSILAKVKKCGPLHSFYEDRRNTIWLGTYSMELIRIHSDGTVENKSFRQQNTNQPVYFYEPDENTFWVIVGGDFYTYSNGRYEPLDMPPVIPLNGLAFINVSAGQAFYHSHHGIMKLTGKSVSPVTGMKRPEFLENPLEIYFDARQNEIWVTSYHNGAMLLRENEAGVFTLARKLMKDKVILSVFCDKEQNTWLSSTGNGIFKISAIHFNQRSYNAQHGLESVPLNCFLIDSFGNIWMGFNNGMINCIRKDQTLIKIDCTLKTEKNKRILGFETDSNHNIWAGSDDGVILIKRESSGNYGKPVFFTWDGFSFAFKSFAKDSKGNLSVTMSFGTGFISTGKHKKEVIPISRRIPFQRTYMHYIDRHDSVWVSNLTGLCKFRNDTLEQVLPGDKRLTTRVTSMAEMHDGTLVLATYGFGVLLLKDGAIVNHISEDNGLAGNICKRLFIAGDTVYVASVGGLSRLILQNNRLEGIRVYTISDGLLSNVVNDIRVIGNTMYVGTSDGLNMLPADFERKKSDPPPVMITSIKINGEITDTLNKISVKYDRQYFQFNFIAPVFDHAEKVIYRYKLGFYDWVETRNSTLEFSALDPGSYTFSVMAKKENSGWSEPAQLSFVILPPFWKTGWFIALSGLLVAALMYILIYHRISRIKSKVQERMLLDRKIASLEMKALRAQMNPHFTFNVMNSIQNFIINNDTPSAVRYLSKFAKLIRMILDNSQSPVIRLAEEINALAIYLELEKMRFKEKFEYLISIDKEIDTSKLMVPSMLLQPYVENAIKHGLRHKIGKGNLSVTFSMNKSFVDCIIEDNGIGRDKAAMITEETDQHVSMGSQIAIHRVDAFNVTYASDISVRIEDLKNEKDEGSGTKIIISIPSKI